MSAVTTTDIPELRFNKRSSEINAQPPFGPSVSGGPKKAPSRPISSMLQNMMAGKTAPKTPKAISDDSYDSSTSTEEKNNTAIATNWTKKSMDFIRSRRPVKEDKVSPLPPSKTTVSVWERTKKLTAEEAKDLSQPGKGKKSKRHKSLDAKTARFYAKRQRGGWTAEGQKKDESSSDDEGGLKPLPREPSPRRKRSSKENTSMSSKTPSRDVSAAPASPRPARPADQKRSDLLPPSANGRDFPAKVPTIKISSEDSPFSLPSAAPISRTQSVSRFETKRDSTIEDWLNARSVSGTDKIKGLSTSQLYASPSSSSTRDQPVSAISMKPSVSSDPWNHMKSRRSLPVGVDESILGTPLGSPISRIPQNNTRSSSFSLSNQNQYVSDLFRNSSDRKVPSTYSSSTNVSTWTLQSENVTGVSSNNAAENIYDQILPKKRSDEPVHKWSSDWQIHQYSTGFAPKPSSSFLKAPSRLAPLKEINHLELERALEELDEFYESLSTKSEDVTLKSSPNNRSDSGMSSNNTQKEEHIYAEPDNVINADANKNRLEYTRNWVRQDTTQQLQNGRKVASMMALNQPEKDARQLSQSPYRKLQQPANNWTSNIDLRKDDYTNATGGQSSNAKPENKLTNSAPKKASPTELPNPSYLLMSVAYTPTVLAKPELEFQKYPGTNRPQPHQEWDDLSARKMIHAQNTPSFKVTTDLSKQVPSARTDYAAVKVDGNVSTKNANVPDTVRDDAAFRKLRNEKPGVVSKVNEVEKKKEKPSGPKTKWISSSIRNLAKHFERPKSPDTPKIRLPMTRKNSNMDSMISAMQINGKRFTLRPGNLGLKTDKGAEKSLSASNSKGFEEHSPKISPMDEKQLDDLLSPLRSVSNIETRNVGSNSLSPVSSRITRFAVAV